MIHICYLCRIPEFPGDKNPDYTGIPMFFNNDHSALLTDQYSDGSIDNPLFQTQAVEGISRVVCFSPDHRVKTISELPISSLRKIIDTLG